MINSFFSVPSITLSGSFPQKPPEYEVVNPTRVDAKGHFLSNFLPHHGSRIQRRHVLEKTRSPERVFYHLLHRGNSLHFNLSLNSHFLATGFLTERRYGGLDGAKLQRHTPSLCHFLGEVWDESTGNGKAAISTCDGLVSGHYTNCPVICFIILVSCHVYFLLIGFCGSMTRLYFLKQRAKFCICITLICCNRRTHINHIKSSGGQCQQGSRMK